VYLGNVGEFVILFQYIPLVPADFGCFTSLKASV
jgi:hypothetical protein